MLTNIREENRQAEIKELTSKGIVPAVWDVEQHPEKSIEARPWLMGRVAAVRFLHYFYLPPLTDNSQLITDVQPAQKIVDDMVADAAKMLQLGGSLVTTKSKL